MVERLPGNLSPLPLLPTFATPPGLCHCQVQFVWLYDVHLSESLQLSLREEGGRDGLEELADFEKTRRRSVVQQQSLCGSALLLAALVTATILVTTFVISQISLATRVIVLNRFGCQRHGATWTRYSISILSNTPFLLIKLYTIVT